jgi:hypothetical protein
VWFVLLEVCELWQMASNGDRTLGETLEVIGFCNGCSEAGISVILVRR